MEDMLKELRKVIIDTMPPQIQEAMAGAMKEYLSDCISELQVIDAEIAEPGFDVRNVIKRHINGDLTYFQSEMVDTLMNALLEKVKEDMTPEEIEQSEAAKKSFLEDETVAMAGKATLY